MNGFFIGGAAIAAIACMVGTGAHAEEPVIGEVLQIMRERGLIDEAKHAELVSKNSAYEDKHTNLLGKIEFSGDFRARLENFWYDRDDTGSNRPNRARGRYRLRLAAKASVNEWTTVHFRISSGGEDPRSRNRTFGSGNDFDGDQFAIDKAYVEFKGPKSWLGENQSVKAMVGKTSNPFRWKVGQDRLIWDGDITPEGAAILFESRPTEAIRAWANLGYYVIDENSTSQDPHFLGVQGGVDYSPHEHIDLGVRGSYYAFGSLNSAFYARAAANGAVTDDGYRVYEVSAYARYKGIENWPVLLYGSVARNMDSGTSGMSSDEDTGFLVGVETGDKKKFAKIGFLYSVAEANYFPAQLVDSNLFDGRTNGKGFVLYASRQILPNTDLNFTLFKSDELRSELPTFGTTVRNSDRIRLQTDVVVKF